MGATSVAVLVVVFVVLLFSSDGFRGAANELFGHYVLGLLRYGWPYLLIYTGYELIENQSAGAIIHTAEATVPYLAQFIVAGIAIILIVMMTSGRLRDVANEIWGHFVVNTMRLAWPYVLIVAAYAVLSDGSAAAFVRRLLAGAM
jgi:hypothetical protein